MKKFKANAFMKSVSRKKFEFQRSNQNQGRTNSTPQSSAITIRELTDGVTDDPPRQRESKDMQYDEPLSSIESVSS